MKDNELRQRFMALRAHGESYAAIARELDISKQTLLKWGNAYKEEIENLRAIELEALKEQYRLTTQAQLALYGTGRLRVLEELQKRDLSLVQTPKLYDLWVKLDAQIKAVYPEPTINDEDTVAAQKELRLLISPSGNGNNTAASSSAARSGTRGLRAEDLTDFLRDTLRRFQAGEISTRDVQTTLAVIKTLFKSVEFVELQQRFEHIEEVVRHASEARGRKKCDERMNEFAHYERRLTDVLCKASAREKGLLIANARAQGNVYGVEMLTRAEMLNMRDSVDASEALQYNEVLRNENEIFQYLLSIQLRYLTLRERMASVAEPFSTCDQTMRFGELLDQISWGKTKTQQKLRTKIMSHPVRFGTLSLSEGDGYESIEVRPSKPIKETALAHINMAKALAIELKTKITTARDFMTEKKSTHLKAYEEYLAGIEGELSGLIRSVKGRIYRLDGEAGQQMREFLAETGDELCTLMEALPDYGALSTDAALYDKERAHLMSG